MDVTKTHQGTGKPNVKWENMDLKVQYEGTRVTLPNDPTKMPLKEGIKFLKRLDEQENTEVSIADVVNCHFYDGIVAFARALNHRYGMALSVPTPGFFGDSPPHIIRSLSIVVPPVFAWSCSAHCARACARSPKATSPIRMMKMRP